MKTTMIAALAAAQLSAAAMPAQAAERPRQEAAMDEARFTGDDDLGLQGERAQPASGAAGAPEEEPRKKKRKSTGDKILTGAAVVLGVGALAVGGLLVAIFVS
ncbi:MAG TPA: hypothetical protein VF688_04445 [Allosphingosinicella sp.]|jgi:hypothetical protein